MNDDACAQNHANDDAHGHEVDDGLELEIDTQSQIFLEMRQQNLDLLKIAAKVAGCGGGHGPLKPGDVKQALKSLWEVYAEFYEWIDPEQVEPEEDEEE